ncbi:hypothetical protein C0993_000212 [Termitomyces sp. T159_Od127]|nr:hypothetical protein C0993_000212 [Termitomyces sp. T159_Od127]
MSSSALEAIESLKLLLLNMRKDCQAPEAKEYEEMSEREQRSMAKEARFNDLFRDLQYIEEGLEDIKSNQLMADKETGKLHRDLSVECIHERETVSPETVEDIMRITEMGRQAQVAHVIALVEGRKFSPLTRSVQRHKTPFRVLRKTQATKLRDLESEAARSR